MKVLVVGSGKMGSEIARELARSTGVEAIGLADIDERSLEKARHKAGSDRVGTFALSGPLRPALSEIMPAFDVGISALPNRLASYQTLEAALDARLNLVDILEEYHRRPDREELEGLVTPGGMPLAEYGETLHQRALEAGITVLDGMGFAPGLSNVLVGEGIRKLDRAESAVARVGGIPDRASAARHPLSYMVTWSFAHVLREYSIDAPVIRAGRPGRVPALSERERFCFTAFGQAAELEAAVTPGMPSMIHTRPGLREFSEMTIRWPGHWDAIQTLKECGLLDMEPARLADGMVAIVPRLFLTSLLQPKLAPGPDDRDVAVMWNTVSGIKEGLPARVDSYLWEEADPARGISAMARVTAYPAVIGALLLGRGEIAQEGILAPEDGITGSAWRAFVDELNERNIHVQEDIRVEG